MIKTKRDYWIEMSIREVWTQCHFAGIAYENIEKKSAKPTDQAFSSIHSFFSHCAMVSKMLQAEEKATPMWSWNGRLFKVSVVISKRKNVNRAKTIGDVLGVSGNSIVHQRKFRNHLEHYDERLKHWIRKLASGANIGTYNIGPRSVFQINNMVFVSHYDPSSKAYTFVDEDFNLSDLHVETERIKALADNWVNAVQFGRIQPPFDKESD